jgi:hypothetical protein
VKLRELTQESDLEFLDAGTDTFAIVSPDDPEKVIAIDYWRMSPLEAKKQYYSQRIAHTLFPHNFPRFYAAYERDPNQQGENLTGTVRQRIRKGTGEVKYSFSDTVQFFKEYSVPFYFHGLGNMGEDETDNIMIGQDGGKYYIDKIFVKPHAWDEKDKERLLTYW